MKAFGKAVIGSALGLAALMPAAWADGTGGQNSVRWETIVGIIEAGSTIGSITGGGEPWTTLGGSAYVDLTNNGVFFNVKGLVLAGGNTIGTPGTVTSVEGALVCAPGASQAVYYTAPVTLDGQGNAWFAGSFTTAPTGCSTSAIAFLIVVASNGHWIANGAVQVPYP